ncbi:hypothetical protein [Microvirga massiliensis]|uniref:hypothetical protein n=1 Tax=Microvirga massiliensis TaxID=1033741 RepID=UPI00062BCC9E|nr:hypothetical protein [Microvirga massiliensis]
MVESVATHGESETIFLLFPPALVPVLDIFRVLGNFEEHYDISALDTLEERLTKSMNSQLAKGIVSDALLLAFGLRRERREPLAYGRPETRRGTADEGRLIDLLAACSRQDFDLAERVAAGLSVAHSKPLVALAYDVARRLEAAGLKLDMPVPCRAVSADAPASNEVHIERASGRSDLRLVSDG